MSEKKNYSGITVERDYKHHTTLYRFPPKELMLEVRKDRETGQYVVKFHHPGTGTLTLIDPVGTYDTRFEAEDVAVTTIKKYV